MLCPTASGNGISIRVKTDDGVTAREKPIAEHVVKQGPFGGIDGKAESRSDEVDVTAQGPETRRKRIDADEATAAFPDV